MNLPASAPTAPRFALVAGEASGDLLAATLLKSAQARWPGLESFGIGGPRMAERGFHAWWPSQKLAVRGYIEVLAHYREITGIRRQLVQRLLQDPPDAFIGVDAPDFNLSVHAQLKARGIKTLHFISPSVWAWRARRIEKIKRSVDHMLCIFPFEPAIYARHGVRATYVGHPLAPLIPMQPDRQAARRRLGLPLDSKVVAILPGSRASEIHYIAPHFLQAAMMLRGARPDLQFILPTLPTLKNQVRAQLQAAGCAEFVRLLEGQSHTALEACDVTLIASGTATLEAALFKRPMVIAYNMHPISWQLMRRLKYQPWVGLPNILCESFVVPEFLQNAATPQALTQATLEWLEQPAAVRALEQRFMTLHQQLLQDTPALITHAIESTVFSGC